MRKYFLIMLTVLILPCAIFLSGCGPEKFNVELSVNNAAYGSVTGAGSYEKDKEITISATPNTGYVFVEWSDDVTTNPRTIVVNEDITLSAIFELSTTYSLSLSANNAVYGSVAGAGSYVKGTDITISATSNVGYEFVKWSDDVTINPRQITINQDVALTAIFEPTGLTYSLNLSSNNTIMGTVSGSGEYYNGQNITITATEKPGYFFTNWNDGSNQATRQITMSEDIELQANFIKGDTKVWHNNHYLIVVNANLEETHSTYYTITAKNESAFGYFAKNGSFLSSTPNYIFAKNEFTQDTVIEAIDSVVGFMVINHSAEDEFYVGGVKLSRVIEMADGYDYLGNYALIYKKEPTNASFLTVKSAGASVSTGLTYLDCELYKFNLTDEFTRYSFLKLYLIDSEIYVSLVNEYTDVYAFEPVKVTVGTTSIYVKAVIE